MGDSKSPLKQIEVQLLGPDSSIILEKLYKDTCWESMIFKDIRVITITPESTHTLLFITV